MCQGVMEAPYANDCIVHGMERCSAASFSLDANPSGSTAVFSDAVEAILANHDHGVASLRLREYWVQIWNIKIMLVTGREVPQREFNAVIEKIHTIKIMEWDCP